MEDMLVMIFDSEEKADEASKSLEDLQSECFINIYSKAVIVKDANGEVSVKQQDGGGPVGIVVGLLAGSLFGLPAGPLGVAVGAGAGTSGGLGYDLAHRGSSKKFMSEVEQSLQPGKAAIVAEVYGEWTPSTNARLNALGGTFFLCPFNEILDAQIQGAVAALQDELTGPQIEYHASTYEAQIRLQKRAEAARLSLETEKDTLQAEIEESQKETEARIKNLQEQADKASGEQKAEINRQIGKLQSYQKRRTNLLKQAWEYIKKALSG